MKTRMQKFPPELWTRKDLDDKNTYVFTYMDDTLYETKVKDIDEANAAIDRQQELGLGGFASGYNQTFGQHCVFRYSAAGRTAKFLMMKHIDASIKLAHDTMICAVKTEPAKKEMPVQVIKQSETKKPSAKKAATKRTAKKIDKVILLCEAVIDGDVYRKHYTFRADEELFEGERKTAHLKSGEYKGVTVVKKTWAVPESQLEHPLDWYVTLCTFLLEEHQLPKKIEPEPVVEQAVEEDNDNEEVITVYSDDCEDEYLPE